MSYFLKKKIIHFQYPVRVMEVSGTLCILNDPVGNGNILN